MVICSCPGKAVTEGDKIVRSYGHNHLADPGTVAGKKAQNDVVKKAAENPKLKTSVLVEEFAAKTEDPSFRTRTVTVKSLKRQIQRTKAKAMFRPAAPKSFDNLEAIPEEYKVVRIVNPPFVDPTDFSIFRLPNLPRLYVWCRPGCSCYSSRHRRTGSSCST
jgi:hypothetical protein